MSKSRDKILEKLAKIEANREENLENLREKEVFYPSLYILLTQLTFIFSLIFVVCFITLKIYKYEYNYVSVIDFCTSPYFISKNLRVIVAIIFSIFIPVFCQIKINLRENYIKISHWKKIYFDDIALVKIKESSDIEIINKSGKKFRIVFFMNNIAKMLFILKENLKEGTLVLEDKADKKNESFIKSILKLIVLYILIKIFLGLLGMAENSISKKYRYDTDFSKYGIVREELSDGGYAEYNYKHGKKNGLAKYYNYIGTVVKEIDYKNNKEIKEKEYTDDGMIAEEREYEKNGNEKVKYYSNGKLKEEMVIEKIDRGELYNTRDLYKRKLYSESGSLILEETMINFAMFQGKRIVYYPNGKIFMKAEFSEKGKLLPPVKVYDNTGKLRIEEEYDKKKDYCIKRIFDENGKLIKTKEEIGFNWKTVYTIKMMSVNYFENEILYENDIERFNKFLENEK